MDNLWFCVDTSGSIDQDTLSAVMTEIQKAIAMFDQLSGKISFFDTQVTEPVPFEGGEEFPELEAIGGGGTDYYAIFRYLTEFPEDEMPTAIVVLTDGYCDFPEEEDALGVPVLWVIYDNPCNPPWGRVARIDCSFLSA